MKKPIIPEAAYQSCVNRLTLRLRREPTKGEMEDMESRIAQFYPDPDWVTRAMLDAINLVAERAEFLNEIEPCPVCLLKDELRIEMGQSSFVVCGRCKISGPGFPMVALIWDRGPHKIRSCVVNLWDGWSIFTRSLDHVNGQTAIKSMITALIGKMP